MARRPARTADDDAETPPWMEREAPPPRRSDRAAREAEPSHTVVTWRALIIGAAIAIVAAIGLVIGVRTLISREPGAVAAEGAPGEVPLIRAPAEPYKIKPAEAGGVQLAGAGDPVIAGAGTEAGSTIDTGATAETPQRPDAGPTNLLPGGSGQDAEAGDAEAAAPTPEAETAPPRATAAPRVPKLRAPATASTEAVVADRHKPRTTKPKPAPVETAGDGRFRLPDDLLAGAKPSGVAANPTRGSLQLGAFSTRAKAEAAWSRYAGAFPEVAALQERIAPVDHDGTTLYRLRATGAGDRAAAICAKMKAAGESCLVSR